MNTLVRIIAEEAGVPPPRLRLPVGPVWLAGAACEALCRPSASNRRFIDAA